LSRYSQPGPGRQSPHIREAFAAALRSPLSMILRALPVKNGSELPTIPVDERANEVRAIKVG
jgi:hypothetical protein